MLHHLVQTKSAEMSVSRQLGNKMAAFLPDHKLAANIVNLAPGYVQNHQNLTERTLYKALAVPG
jgi:hypothetical protein